MWYLSAVISNHLFYWSGRRLTPFEDRRREYSSHDRAEKALDRIQKKRPLFSVTQLLKIDNDYYHEDKD